MSVRRCSARGAVALALALAAAAAPLAGQARPFPYKLTSGRESTLLVAGAATLAAAIAISAELDVLTAADVSALSPSEVNGFDRSATANWSRVSANLSDGALLASVAAPLSLMAAARGPGAPLTVGVMLGETILLANGIGQLAKTALRRTRPFVYNDDPEIPPDAKFTKTARQSFPSGHTANAFASAVFVSTVYARLHPTSSLRPWIWAGSLALAGTVGYLRYDAGKHYPTDVLAGAVLGGAIGWLVPKVHEGDRVRVTLAPDANGTAVGLSLRF